MIVRGPYTEGVGYPQIKKLLDFALRSFGNEFDLFFNKAEWAKKCVFEYNERALVGLLNNAIIRHSDEYCTFQEYHVYERDQQVLGRADLLVVHNDFDLLFEAKKWEYDGREYADINGLFKEPREQLVKYYEAEKSYFRKGQTFLSVLIFEYVAEDYLKNLKKQYGGNKAVPEKGVDFDAFYATEHNGLMVYGHVFQPGDGAT